MMKESQDTKKRKRSAHGTRASAACSRCRKIKSKCERGPDSISCIRCDSLGHDCSFSHEPTMEVAKNYSPNATTVSHPGTFKEYFASIEMDLMGVLQKVREASVTNSILHPTSSEIIPKEFAQRPIQEEEPLVSNMDAIFFNSTPINDILDISRSKQVYFSREIGYQLSESKIDVSQYDLVDMGILSIEFALELFSLCHHNQGKWISFPVNIDVIQLFTSVRENSPLLMATCCLVGLKYCSRIDLGESISLRERITKIVGDLVKICSFTVPQNTEYFQSIILISSQASSLSYKDVYFDGWLLSGHSLIHFITREMNQNTFQYERNNPESFLNFKIWNVMCLLCLSHSVLSGRPCLIDELRFDQCRDILDSSYANTFDGEIVSYISIMLALYNSLILKENLNTSVEELDRVHKDWGYLTEQLSSNQYVDLFHHFSMVMIYRRYYLSLFMPKSIHVSLEEYHRKHIIKNDENLKQIVRKLDQACITLLKEATLKLDYKEISTSIDIVKLFVSFTALLSMSLIQAGLVNENPERQAILKSTEAMFKRLSQDYNKANHFDKGIHVLLTKNLESTFG